MVIKLRTRGYDVKYGTPRRTALGELYEQDPLWYDIDDIQPCHQCGGQATFPVCLSNPDWCEANPIIGREGIASGTPEWFVLPERGENKKNLL